MPELVHETISEGAVNRRIPGLVAVALAWSLASIAFAGEPVWRLWVTSEIEPWHPFLEYPDRVKCEAGIRYWIKANEGHWGSKGGENGLWSPVKDGHAWGIVETKAGAKRRIDLLCLPVTATPSRTNREE